LVLFHIVSLRFGFATSSVTGSVAACIAVLQLAHPSPVSDDSTNSLDVPFPVSDDSINSLEVPFPVSDDSTNSLDVPFFTLADEDVDSEQSDDEITDTTDLDFSVADSDETRGKDTIGEFSHGESTDTLDSTDKDVDSEQSTFSVDVAHSETDGVCISTSAELDDIISVLTNPISEQILGFAESSTIISVGLLESIPTDEH